MGLSKFEYSQLEPIVNLAVQSCHILHRFPDFIYRREHGGAVWRGTLQPRQFSQKYRVAVYYKLSSLPTVRVICPALAPKAPHLWKDGTLCLYQYGSVKAQSVVNYVLYPKRQSKLACISKNSH